MPVRRRRYGAALNEIQALKDRNRDLEQDNQLLLAVLDEAREAIRNLSNILDPIKEVTR